MLKNQAEALNRTGLELLEKAGHSTSMKDIQTFTELGLKCLAESRAVTETIQRNSALFFCEISLAAGFKPTHAAFLRFCERNGFDPVCEEDFKSVTDAIFNSPVGETTV